MQTTLRIWLALIASMFAIHNAMAAPSITFSDTWQDSLKKESYAGYYTETKGLFSANISVPLNGADLSTVDSDTIFVLLIGPYAADTTIFGGALADAAEFSLSNKTATYAFEDGNGRAIGKASVHWSGKEITISAVASADMINESTYFRNQSPGTNTSYNLDSHVTKQFFDVNVEFVSGDGYEIYNFDTVVAVTGSDKEKDPNPDGNGPYPLESGSVKGTSDLTPPKLAITRVGANIFSTNGNPTFEVNGTASDPVGITSAGYILNSDTNALLDMSGEIRTTYLYQADQFTNAAETNYSSVDWSVQVELTNYGPSQVTFIAEDAAGRLTAITRQFSWIEPTIAELAVNPPGAGTVAGIKNGQKLDVGFSYTVSTAPKNTSYLFLNWTDGNGNVLATSNKFNYLDTDGKLTANFVPNPFLNRSLTGTFAGSYFDYYFGESPRSSGYITFTVSPSGAFSGRLYNGGYVKNVASLSGQFTGTPDGTGANALSQVIEYASNWFAQVSLSIEFYTNDDLSVGSGVYGTIYYYDDPELTNELEWSGVFAGLCSYNGTPPGIYNFVLAPVSSDPSAGPGGYSPCTAIVSTNGNVAMKLNLADGISPPITFDTDMLGDGTCFVFASLYNGAGLLSGSLDFATNVTGSLEWDANPGVRNSAYKQGFSGSPSVIGSFYQSPKGGSNVLGWTSGALQIDGDYSGLSLPDGIDIPVTFNPVKNTFSDSSNAPIKLTPSNGAFTGSFKESAKKAATFSGVIFNGAGYGYYKGTNGETGSVTIASD